MDDRRVLSGIAHVQQVGCRWQDAPAVYGTHKTLYSRWNRWSKNSWFGETMEKLAIRGKKAHIIMIDSTCFKVHRTVAGLKCYVGELGRLIGKTRGGWNTKLHALCDAKGQILSLYLTGANVSDHKGAEVLLEKLPNRVEHFLGDMGYDSNEIRNILESMGIEPCIPGKKNRVVAIEYDTEFYKERNKIERAFGRIKDWRRVPPVMTGARRCFYPLVLSWQSSSSGCNLMNPDPRSDARHGFLFGWRFET